MNELMIDLDELYPCGHPRIVSNTYLMRWVARGLTRATCKVCQKARSLRRYNSMKVKS